MSRREDDRGAEGRQLGKRAQELSADSRLNGGRCPNGEEAAEVLQRRLREGTTGRRPGPTEKRRARSAQSTQWQPRCSPSEDKEQKWEPKKEMKRKAKREQGTQRSEPRKTKEERGGTGRSTKPPRSTWEGRGKVEVVPQDEPR